MCQVINCTCRTCGRPFTRRARCETGSGWGLGDTTECTDCILTAAEAFHAALRG